MASDSPASAAVYKLPESVLVVVHTADLDVLLLERAGSQESIWQSVTGSREAADTDLRTTAMREVCEETGLDVVAGLARGWRLRDWRLRNRYEILPSWRHRYGPDVTHNVEHVFGLTLSARQPVTLHADEHRRFLWLPWQEAQARCFFSTNRDAIGMLPQFAAVREATP